MPVDPNADIEVTALKWVPDGGRGMVRDMRVRWALEELGLPYRVRLIEFLGERSEEYLRDHPFGQVPVLVEGDVRMFESGAIVLYLGERGEPLLPRDAAGRARAMSWVLAALNSIEPAIWNLVETDIFEPEAEWARLRRPQVVDSVRQRLGRLSDWLGDKEYLEGNFSAGDLIMTTVLRILRFTDLVAEFPNLAAYKSRCEARPTFQRALAAQLADFEEREAA